MTQKEWSQTKNGMISDMFSQHKARSKRRGHSQPTYSLDELKEWCYSQKQFHLLYDNWKRLDYQTAYRPSVDRINDYIGYTISNIQLMTVQENKDKAVKDKLNGVNNKQNKAILLIDSCGKIIEEYHSASAASRALGVNVSSIIKVCKGNLKSTGKMKFKYKKDI